MSIRLLLIVLFLSTFTGYLEWGEGNTSFLIQAEIEVIRKFFTDPMEALHPLTLLPLFGQLLILFAVFQKEPRWKLIFTGMGCIGLLLALMFVIGVMSLNYKIVLSTLPFLVTSVLLIRRYRKR